MNGSAVELTILMPCLDEAETLRVCVEKARGFLERSGVVGEVLIADNGSTDGSQAIAEAAGARVVPVARRGYGSALIAGIEAARGRFVIMGDADDSYDFSDLSAFVAELRAGADLVMGNRFAGGIEDGAMPPLHRYLGNPVLSFIGRLFFKTRIRDFHCGLRGFQRDRMLALNLHTTGMEFASEVVVRSVLAGYRITEVPTTLSKDGRSRPPHLRSWRDGWRHLRFLLLYSPRWLFLVPGLVMALLGALATIVLLVTPVTVGSVTFDIGTLLYATAVVVVGVQATAFALLTKVYAVEEGFLPRDRRLDRVTSWLGLETGLIVGGALFLLGVLAAVLSVNYWQDSDFGQLDAAETVRAVVPAVLGFMLGAQVCLNSFFLSILGLGRRNRPEVRDYDDEQAQEAMRAPRPADGPVPPARPASAIEGGGRP
ncbi:glycosyltransferase family 2 protein [Modestobacter versicolor]|uniref:glycosyltransferase family 2 protein n=1 Tax=Modestobacter versicolor TaxID=429133 RepID=UPI0034DE67D4